VSSPLAAAATATIEAAYALAYEEHWHDVFRFALSWTNDWGEAEDLAQEAFTRLWRHRAKLDWEGKVLPWLLVTTRRLATDRFRRLRRRRRPSSSPVNVDMASWDRWIDVRSSMALLSPLERSALVMTAVMGHPSAEAAATLGVSPGAVRAAVSRARVKLQAS